MKKNYILLGLLLSCSFVSGQSSLSVNESLTLYDLTHERMNTVYTDNQGNTIKVVTNEPTSGTHGTFTYSADLDNPLSCALESSSSLNPAINSNGFYSKAILSTVANATVLRSPYFILDFGDANTGIREIQLMGRAIGSVEGTSYELLYGFSSETNPSITNTSSDFDLPDPYEPLKFIVGECNYDNLRIKLPAGTVSVAFIATTKAFGGWQTSDLTVAQIEAIRFYAEDTATGIEEDVYTKDIGLKLQGRELTLKNECDIEVYDVSGHRVLGVKAANNLSLSDLQRGLYIIKLTNKENNFNLSEKIFLN